MITRPWLPLCGRQRISRTPERCTCTPYAAHGVLRDFRFLSRVPYSLSKALVCCNLLACLLPSGRDSILTLPSSLYKL